MLDYNIEYTAKNTYENGAASALWQFMITPADTNSQKLSNYNFSNSLDIPVEESINGYDFKTFLVKPKTNFKEIEFFASFQLTKKVFNIFEEVVDVENEFEILKSTQFRGEHLNFLRNTLLTNLPGKVDFKLNPEISLFENLQHLNKWIFDEFSFKTNVTDVDTGLEDILKFKQGVCQDFTHLFIAIAKDFGIPARYISGYLHQGNGYFGDSQMHAWVECYLPKNGWIGFDPTNNLFAAENHIKVSHGKDYTDCSPLKGIVYSSGENETEYHVKVSAQKQQQQQQ